MDRTDLLQHAVDIAGEYNGNLTLRQLYYQVVARGFGENSQKAYKRLGDTICNARLAGEFPFAWLMDRTRESRPGAYSDHDRDVDTALDSAVDAIKYTPNWYLKCDRWWGQRTHVSVWVEKEAMAGVFEHPCDQLGVSWFVCRGYPSLSALYQWVTHLGDVTKESRSEGWSGEDYQPWDDISNGPPSGIEKAIILYFGDHDPDGWQIPRSAHETLAKIANVEGITIPPVELHRVALNMDQIRRFNPPPFPAKETSSRYEGYVREHGITDAWELDALRPEELTRLIRASVAEHFDTERHSELQSHINDLRGEMRERMRDPEWIAKALEE